MGRILVTGFEPYGHTPINPAELVASALDGKEIEGSMVTAIIVPNNFFECIDVVSNAISETESDIVVLLGEYPGRATISVERIAQNENDSTRYDLADNAGIRFQDKPTAPDGPVAYLSTLPIRAMVEEMTQSGIPAEISDTAGTFVCNHIMYGVLHHIAMNELEVRAGLVHLPALPEVAALPVNLGMPSMSVETASHGLEVALGAVVRHPTDVADPIPGRLQV